MGANLQTEWWRPSGVPSGVDETGTTEIPAKGEDRVAFGALLVFTFILILSPQSFIPALKPLRIAFLAAMVGIAGGVLGRLLRRQPVVPPAREMILVAALVAWAIFTLPLSYWPGGSAMFLLDVYFKTLAVFWLLGMVANTPYRLRVICWALSVMMIPLAITAIDNLASNQFISAISGPGAARITGYDAPLTKNPNDLALMINLILPLTIALFLATRRFGLRLVLLALISLDVIAIIATFSRAGFLTLCVTGLTYLLIMAARKQRLPILAVVAMLLFSFPLLPESYVERMGTITSIESDPSGSAQERWRDTMAAVRHIADDPVTGAGVGMNIFAMNEMRGEEWTEIHNVYLEYAVELGLPGLLLFLLLMRECLRKAWKARRTLHLQYGRNEIFFLVEGICVSLVAFTTAALFYPVAYHFHFYYLAGLVVAAGAIAGDRDVPPVNALPGRILKPGNHAA